ncbi:phosphatidylcholine transfer protein-like [Clavelina lepadiformis]|uniref:START domain-containing protein n=1 Tax=Clavelina lepadiformis TaxID=159417 RepID=A0ABP0FGW3_CLALP
MVTSFKEQEFDIAVKEMECPDVSGWELFVETHGIKVFRYYRVQSKLYEYKVFGITNMDADKCALVYMDIAYRKTWDSYVKELTYLRKGDPEVIYWEVAYPWPMSNRDYVYLRQAKTMIKNEKNVYAILGRSAKPGELEERETVDPKRGVIRVDDYLQSMVIADNGKGTSRIYMHYYDNPKGHIPAVVVNWAAKTGVASFLTTLEEACRSYRLE